MLNIRPASAGDVPLIRAMICELADFERELDSVSITESQLVEDGFGAHPVFHVMIAEWKGEPAGYLLYFECYGTWAGRHMFVEDLFVRPQYRGKSIGKALIAEVAAIAKSKNCVGMRWVVFGSNQTAIDLYRSLGAEFLDDCKLVLLRSEAFDRLAEAAVHRS